MGKKITQYTNNVSVNPDLNSLLDLSEKTGTTTFESRKWTLTAFKTWVNSWVVAGSVAWSSITGKPTTLSGYGITDAVDGSGTTDYVPKWSDSNTLTDSSIRETGGKVGINTAPVSTARLKLAETDGTTPLRAENNITSTSSNATVGSFQNDAVNSAINYGVNTLVQNSSNTNIGVQGRAIGSGTSYSIGGQFSAEGTTTNKYSVNLKDGTEGVAGRFLRNMDTDGNANWANIAISDVNSLQTSLDSKQNTLVSGTSIKTINSTSLLGSGDIDTISPRVQSVTSSATVTPTATNDLVKITAQAVGLTLANPTGAFSEGQALMIRIKDNGTAQTIAFDTNYRAIGVTLPTTTVISKTLYLGIIYNSTDGKWDVVGYQIQA